MQTYPFNENKVSGKHYSFPAFLVSGFTDLLEWDPCLQVAEQRSSLLVWTYSTL